MPAFYSTRPWLQSKCLNQTRSDRDPSPDEAMTVHRAHQRFVHETIALLIRLSALFGQPIFPSRSNNSLILRHLQFAVCLYTYRRRRLSSVDQLILVKCSSVTRLEQFRLTSFKPSSFNADPTSVRRLRKIQCIRMKAELNGTSLCNRNAICFFVIPSAKVIESLLTFRTWSFKA